MSTSATSLSPLLTNVLQTLTAVGSPIASSQQAITALENAPASDIVKLSNEASQLQGLQVLFGDSSNSGISSSDSLLSTLYGSDGTLSSTSSANSSSEALLSALYGVNDTSSSDSTSSLSDLNALLGITTNSSSTASDSLLSSLYGSNGTTTSTTLAQGVQSNLLGTLFG